MPIEFAYMQARVQARHGDRLTLSAWQLLESARGLGQYLHAARGTALAQRVQSLSATSSAHAIERTLRREWRGDVELASHWMPAAWRPAVEWTTWLADLPSIAWLGRGGESAAWMRDDPVVSRFALPDEAARRREFSAAGLGPVVEADDVVTGWLGRFRALWPYGAAAARSLQAYIDLLTVYRNRLADAAGDDTGAGAARDDLEAATVRLIRRNLQQPVTVFCHLLLVALDLGRLRNGLVRRALTDARAAES